MQALTVMAVASRMWQRPDSRGRGGIQGTPSGLNVYSWECSNCSASYVLGPDKPAYCPYCGEPVDEATNWGGL